MKRRPGHASVEEHPKGSGLWRVRIRFGKGFKTLGSKLPKGAATELADAQAAVRNAKELRDGLLLETFGVAFMARRAEQGVRGVRKDELRWNKHIAAAPIGKLAVSTLLRSDIVEWRDGLAGIEHRSKQKLLNLLRVALDEAVEAARWDRQQLAHRLFDRSRIEDLAEVIERNQKLRGLRRYGRKRR